MNRAAFTLVALLAAAFFSGFTLGNAYGEVVGTDAVPTIDAATPHGDQP